MSMYSSQQQALSNDLPLSATPMVNGSLTGSISPNASILPMTSSLYLSKSPTKDQSPSLSQNIGGFLSGAFTGSSQPMSQSGSMSPGPLSNGSVAQGPASMSRSPIPDMIAEAPISGTQISVEPQVMTGSFGQSGVPAMSPQTQAGTQRFSSPEAIALATSPAGSAFSKTLDRIKQTFASPALGQTLISNPGATASLSANAASVGLISPKQAGKLTSMAVGSLPIGTTKTKVVDSNGTVHTKTKFGTVPESMKPFISSLTIAEAAPSPTVPPPQNDVIDHMSTATAEQILMSMGLTPTRTIVALPQNSSSPTIARYITVSGESSVQGGKLTIRNGDGERGKPFTALVALDTDVKVQGDAGYTPVVIGSPTVVESAPAEISNTMTTKHQLLSRLPGSISGIATISPNAVQTIHRGGSLSPKASFLTATTGQIEEGVLTVVSEGGVQSGVVSKSGGTGAYSEITSTLPIVSLSNLISNPSGSVEHILESKTKIDAISREVFDAEVKRLNRIIASTNETFKSLASSAASYHNEVCEYFSKYVPASSAKIECALGVLSNYNTLYNQKRAATPGHRLSDEEEMKASAVLINLAQHAKMGNDVPRLAEQFLSALDEMVTRHSLFVSTLYEQIGDNLHGVNALLSALEVTHDSIGGDFTYTGE
jgi:hypothetical protein